VPESQIYERLNEIFRDVIGDDSITLTPATTAQDVEGWDSVTNISLMVSIETQFGVKIRTDEIETLKNVADMVALIQSKAR
jgi:acyl carrier protein